MQSHVTSIQIKQHLTSKQKHCEHKAMCYITFNTHPSNPSGPGPQSKCLHCSCHSSTSQKHEPTRTTAFETNTLNRHKTTKRAATSIITSQWNTAIASRQADVKVKDVCTHIHGRIHALAYHFEVWDNTFYTSHIWSHVNIGCAVNIISSRPSSAILIRGFKQIQATHTNNITHIYI